MFLRFIPLIAYLFFSPDGGGSGGDGGGSGDGGGDGGTGNGGTGSGSSGGSAGGSGDGGEGGDTGAGDTGPMVPKARFDEVLGKLRTFETAERQRADDEAAKKGEFEKVKSRIEGENTGLRETISEVARRNAFYAEAGGRVKNLRLAYIAAADAGLLDGLNVEIKLDTKTADVTGDVKKIVEDVLKANPELKATSTSFGEPGSGRPPSDGIDVEKLTPAQKMARGYEEAGSRRR